MCGKKRGRRSKGDTWWLNKDMKEAVLRKKEAVSRNMEAHKAICLNRTEENKWRFKSMKNKASKGVSTAIGEKAKETNTELQNCPNGMLRLVK